MNRKITVTATILAAAMLSGCAGAQMSSFLPNNFNDQQQQAAQVTPGVVVSVSPAGSVGGSLFAGTRPGQDIVVKTLTDPAQMLSVVQPLKNGGAAFTAGEQVGVVTRDGNARVIPLPGYSPASPSVLQPLPPITQTHMSLKSPFGN